MQFVKYEPVADDFRIDREIFGFVQHETFAFGKAVLARSFISRCCGCFDGALRFASATFSLTTVPHGSYFWMFNCTNVTCALSSVAVTISLSMNHCTDPSDPVALSPKSKKMESFLVSPASCNCLTVPE
jgi:hypothetical protein